MFTQCNSGLGHHKASHRLKSVLLRPIKISVKISIEISGGVCKYHEMQNQDHSASKSAPLKLYFSSGACSLASHITLEELKYHYEGVKISLDQPETIPGDFDRISPMGSVPVLVLENGESITEGVAIMQYLGDRAENREFMPKSGTIERTRVVEALNFLATELHKGFSPLWAPETLVSDLKAQDELCANTLRRLDEVASVFQARLGDRHYFFGTHFTAVDAYAFTLLSWAKWVEWDLSRFPKLQTYLARVAERPSVISAMKSEGLIT
jgi:glutathione S-transferase